MPSSASAVTLLPEPDSPTMPSVSPGLIANETPLTACTVPRDVQNSTNRSATWSSGSDTSAELGVEGLAQPVADQVEAEDEEHDGPSREEGEVRGRGEEAVDAREHRPPLRDVRIRRGEPEEAESGDVDDRRRHRERPLHDHRRDRVGEDVREHDPASADADGPRGEHEVGL